MEIVSVKHFTTINLVSKFQGFARSLTGPAIEKGKEPELLNDGLPSTDSKNYTER